MNFRFFFCFFFIIINFNFLFGQELIEQLSYKQLKDSILKHNYNQNFINLYAQKAKKENDTFHRAESLYYKTFLVDDKNALPYADSIIDLTINFKNRTYPALGYLLKGWCLFLNGQDETCIKYYLIAYDYALNNNNIFQKIYIKDAIASTYNDTGQYEKSLEIYKDLYDYILSLPDYNKKYASNYSSTLNGIANAYIRGKQMDSAYTYIKEGLNYSKKINDTIDYNGFRHQYAQYLFYKKNYHVALDSLKRLATDLNGNMNLAMNYNVQSNIYAALNQKKQSITYLEKIDSLYLENKVPFMEHVTIYKKLYDYYYLIEDKEKQLHAINKLFESDSISSGLRKTINSNSLNEIDLLKLKEEKVKLLEDLNKEHNKTNYIIITTVIISIILITILIKLHLSKKKLKARFENLVQNQDNIASKTKTQKTTQETTQKSLHISKDIIDAILEGLTQFEDNKNYLDNQITLASLAKQLNTNSVYLSKIINHYKGRSLSNYLTDLRINYCVSELRQNTTLRKYTIKALALEMGFRNSESFSKAFKKQTGLNPSYFIKELNKLDEKS